MLHYSGEGEAPLVDKPTYALLRRSRTMIRWSLYGLVDDRRTVTVGMFRETVLLLKEFKAGRAWSSFQKYEVGWFEDQLLRSTERPHRRSSEKIPSTHSAE